MAYKTKLEGENYAGGAWNLILDRIGCFKIKHSVLHIKEEQDRRTNKNILYHKRQQNYNTLIQIVTLENNIVRKCAL